MAKNNKSIGTSYSEGDSAGDNAGDNDNYVITQYKSAPGVSEFLLRNGYYAMNSSRAHIIFEPYPLSWRFDKSDRNKLIDTLDINGIVKSKNIEKNIETVLRTVENSYNDMELIEHLGINTYELVRFILESNKMMIKPDNLLKSTDTITIANASVTPKEFKLQLESILQFKLIHTQLVEDKFKDKKTVYLYHGSHYENWYSIMRKGAKIGSNSKYFMNGAALGNGIYLSNDINMSLGYSNDLLYNASSRYNKDDDHQIILAIFEVIDNPKWHKSGTIYVVDDENALILRYLLVFDLSKAQCLRGIFNAINRKLNTGGIKEFEKEKKEMEAKNITTIHNKRLMREYQNIMKQSPDTLGFRIELLQEDNLSKWMVYITKPENTKLESQMKKLNIPAIEIEITFKENYPIAPPFIRVVYPHFKFHSGHITVGGSLCMEMLTNQGWSPTFNVENVITQIKLAISDGGGAIDEVNYKKRYTMDEAVDSFKRVLASHGWV